MKSSGSFTEILSNLTGFSDRRGGGRRPDERNQSASERTTTWKRPVAEQAARLTIVQITDVYTLDNFASLKTMLQEIRKSQHEGSDGSNPVISMVSDREHFSLHLRKQPPLRLCNSLLVISWLHTCSRRLIVEQA